MRIIGKILGANRTNTSIHRRSNAGSGALRRRLKTTVMAVIWSIAVLTVMAGRRKSIIPITTKSQLVIAWQTARRNIVLTITQKAK